MSVTDLTGIQVPPATAAWIERVILAFLALFVVWLLLKVVAFAYRRSYNLSPVATAGSKNIRPDFLDVDRSKQKELLARGQEFGRTVPGGMVTAERLANAGVIVSGVLTFVTAVFLAFGSIEEFDKTWRSLSGWDRFVAIVQSHPVGFAVALAMVVAALIRLTTTLRGAK